MKPRELLYMLGVRSQARTYPYEITSFDLPTDGQIQYAQWLHPAERKKVIRQEAVAEVRKFVAPGDVAIDIGAHTGDSSIPIALAAGLRGSVLALEPNPYVFPVLKKNSELNLGKCTIVPLMFAALAPRIRFVKVDTEGYDYVVLASLKELLSAQKPFIKAEVFKLLNLSQRQRLYDFFVDLDYDVFRVECEVNYLGARLRRQDLMAWRHYDVFCVPRESAL